MPPFVPICVQRARCRQMQSASGANKKKTKKRGARKGQIKPRTSRKKRKPGSEDFLPPSASCTGAVRGGGGERSVCSGTGRVLSARPSGEKAHAELLRQTTSNKRLRIAIATVRETSLCNGSSRQSPTKIGIKGARQKPDTTPRRAAFSKSFHFRPKTQSTEPKHSKPKILNRARSFYQSIQHTPRAKGRQRNRSHVATRPQRSSTF